MKITLHYYSLFFVFLLISSSYSYADSICTNTSNASVSGTLYDSGGGSFNYQNNNYCGFLIQPVEKSDITLSFSAFNYETFFDYVYVYDGTNTSGTLLGSFTGSSIPPALTATSGAMYILHVTDYSITRSGFVATWSSSPSINLVAEWHFDESGWAGNANEVIDNMGNLSGFSVNGAATTTTGQVCGAASFDGVDDYLTVTGIDTYLNKTSSLSFWMKTSQSGNNIYWMAPGITGIEEVNRSSNDIFWAYLRSDGKLGFGKGGSHHITSSVSLNNNTWKHVVLTRNETSGELKMYINGILNRSAIGRTGGLSLNFSSIGRIEDTAGTPGYFSGQLDEMLVFGSVISAAQVQSIYANQSAGKNWDGSVRFCDPEPIMEWRLEETSWNGTSDEVIDSSGNDYHGQRLLNASPQNSYPAISGSMGTCSYGSFSSGSIAVSGLPVSIATNAKTTVSFWMRWDGTNGSMPIGWNYYDLWFYNGSFGFNTWNNDIYGISSAGLHGSWHHITAEFTNGNNIVSSNRLWVDGVAQILSQRVGSPYPYFSSVGSQFRVGGASNSTGYRFHGDIDEVRIYSNSLTTSQVVNIMNETHPCGGTTAGYFSITHDNNAIYCLSEAVSVSARYSDSTIMSSYNNTITLDTQTGTGTWSLVNGSGSFADNVSNDGIATYTFDSADNGVADFTLDYQEGSRVINIDVYDSETRDDDTEGDLTFAATGFSVTANPLANPPVSPINDPVPTQVSGESFSLALAAYGIHPENGECGVIETYTGSKNIHLMTTYTNPSSGTLLASGAGAVSFVAGQATILSQYNDAGEINLTVRDVDENISGASNNFVVKPKDFSIVVSNNPATTNGGSGFVAAGDMFTVNVQALNSLGDPTPNYGNENIPENVSVTLDSLVFPIGGNVGSLSGESSFTKIDADTFQNSSLSWNEVGSIRLSAAIADGDYLGVGNVESSPSGTIGRFYPDRFFISNATMANSCNNFTYLSEPNLSLSYTLSAIASDGSTVTNYDEGLSYPVATVNYHAELNNSGADIGGRLSASTANWLAGEYRVVDNQAVFSRSSGEEAPLNAIYFGVSASDVDDRTVNNPDMNPSTSDDCVAGESCTAHKLGEATFYYGRLRLHDAYGPETAALPVKMQTEYWDGQQFILNIDDSCTVLPRPNIYFNGNAINSLTDLSVNLSGGITAAQFAILSGSEVGLLNGDAGLSFSAPGTGISVKSFTVDVDLSSIDWLRFDWNQNGNHNDDTALPTSIMSFKTYRGHDRILYWRQK
jgi:MSHA biogenesis protein MshQ